MKKPGHLMVWWLKHFRPQRFRRLARALRFRQMSKLDRLIHRHWKRVEFQTLNAPLYFGGSQAGKSISTYKVTLPEGEKTK